MKLFLVFLFVASCQAMSFFRNSEVELKNLEKVVEKVMYNQLVKAYPNENPNELGELAIQIAFLFKIEGNTLLAPFFQRANMAFNVEYGALERRGFWDTLNDTLHRIIGHLNGKFGDLKDFFRQTIKIESEKLQSHLINKKLAQDLLTDSGVFIKLRDKWVNEFLGHFDNKSGDLDQTIKKIQENP